MSESSPHKANGPSPGRNTRQSRRLQGETPSVEKQEEIKSPRKSPNNSRQRTQSQTSIGSTGSKGRRQRTTSFASSNGSRHGEDIEETMDGDVPDKVTPKNERKRRQSISFNESTASIKSDKSKNVAEKSNTNANDTIKSQNDVSKSQNDVAKTQNSVGKPQNDAPKIQNDVAKPQNDSQKQTGNQKKGDGGRQGNRKQKQAGQKRAAESYAELFKQAVISKDFDKFTTVLRNMGGDQVCRKNTIQELDASFVIPTLKYINEVFRDDRIRERTTYMRDFRFTIDFMELLLQVHGGYLSTLTDLDRLLGDLVQFAKARTANIDRLNELEGQINFVYDQVKARSNPVTFGQQKEETYFEDNGRQMRRSVRTNDAEKDDKMDTS